MKKYKAPEFEKITYLADDVLSVSDVNDSSSQKNDNNQTFLEGIFMMK